MRLWAAFLVGGGQNGQIAATGAAADYGCEAWIGAVIFNPVWDGIYETITADFRKRPSLTHLLQLRFLLTIWIIVQSLLWRELLTGRPTGAYSQLWKSLPVSIQKLLSIDTGDKLAAYASGDVIMLKTLKLPSAEEFEASLDEAQKWAKSVGYNENDVNDIIKSVRKKKRVWELW